MPFKAGSIYGEASLDSKKWMLGLSSLQKQTALTMGAITAVMVAATAKSAKAANEYTKELTNVNTLLDETVTSVDDVNKAILGMDSTLGSTTELTKAMYQAFSAGAEDLDAAMNITTTSAKFAKAGLTEINTAVDVLTTAINAYGEEVVNAEQASDIFFTTIKKGKITGDQLASSIGTSIPLYASAGIALEELSAGLAAMTKQGVGSAMATTQLNAIVNGFLKPSETMIENLKGIGFESGSAFLEAEGLAGALDLVAEASDGDAAKIAALLPNIRAMRGAMALTGVGGKEFTETLKEMENAAGATEVAFDKQEKTWETFLNSAKKAEIQVGLVTKEFVDKLVVGLTAATEWFNNLDQSTIDFIGNFFTVGSVIGTVTLAVMGLSAAFTVLAANPVVAITAGIFLMTTGVVALAKSLNDKAIRDATPRFEELAEVIGITADEVEKLAEASISLDRFFEAQRDVRNPYSDMVDDSVAITKQIEEMAKRFEITELQAVEVALASEKINEEQIVILENLRDEINARNILLISQRITKELNSATAIIEEKSLMRIREKEKTQQSIIDTMEEEQRLQNDITKRSKELELIEQSRLEGVIEARKTALSEYDKALETIGIRENLSIINRKELLEESIIAAESHRDSLVAIGFDGVENILKNGEMGLEEGDKQLLESIERRKILLQELEDFEIESAWTANEKVEEDTEETVDDMIDTWEEYFGVIMTGYSSLTNNLFDLLSQFGKNRQAEIDLELQNELKALEDQLDAKLITQEDYETKVNEVEATALEKTNTLKEKQFKADKVNRISGVAQSAASSIMGWWEVAPQLGPIAGPIFGWGMTALTGGFALAQSAAIASEQFVPAMATGGTGSGLTRVNEQGGEILNLPDGTVVVPNDISRMIAQNAGMQNNINVSFAGAMISNQMDLNRIVDQVSKKLGRQLRTA